MDIKPIELRPLLNVEKPGTSYQPRPGAYAIVFDNDHRLLSIKEKTGYFFPGGGQDQGESLAETLMREVQEELQVAAEPVQYLLAADDCRYSPVYQQSFHIQSHYFLTKLEQTDQLVSEPESEIHWLPLAELKTLMVRKSDQWLCELLSENIQLVLDSVNLDELRQLHSGHIFWQQSHAAANHEISLVYKVHGEIRGWLKLALAPSEYEIRGMFLASISDARPLISAVESRFPGIAIVDPGGLFSQ